MAGTLYVVATPIGHLEDITLRALRILREVSVVAAEDTRRSGNLLRHYDITTPLLSLHEHNEHARAPQLVRRLIAGDSVALVTDAGTPGISDPGAILVAEARRHQIRVEPIPGPSSVMAALSVSGLPGTAFAFHAFPPIRSKARKQWFQEVSQDSRRAVVFFEAPHRISATLAELSDYVKRPIIVFRELTKAHEEAVTGEAAVLASRWEQPKGEFTVVIPPVALESDASQPLDLDRVQYEFGLLTENEPSVSCRDAARKVAERIGVPTRRIYDAVLQLARQGRES